MVQSEETEITFSADWLDRYVPRKRSDLLELDMGDGIILYDDASKLVHHLNPSASIIWQLFEGEANASTLATETSEELGVDLDQARADIAALITELEALGLVEDAAGMRP